MKGLVFNTHRFSLYDGPGIRTVIFLKGCPLRCKWCHNPEGLLKKIQVMYNPERCIGCGDCVAACERGLHTLTDGIHCFNRSDSCIDCMSCARACYSKALNETGKYMTAEEVVALAMRDFAMYQESGGGITISGGEPLYQGDFTLEVLKLAKKQGLHTCMETSGFGDSKMLNEIAEYTDLFLFDYKATGDELHRELCKVPQTPILHNLALLAERQIQIILRCPIVPGLNDLDYHIKGIADIAAKYKSITEVNLEPYHRMGISKANQLGMSEYYNGEVPLKENMEKYRLEIEKICGKKTIII